MELVYLWVEDYKNIQKQGFNFSPKFECTFHDKYENGEEKERLEENCELIIEPKEHIENFFGENINVTAIVGKNGSGKSSVLELISFIITSKEFDINFMLLTFSDMHGYTLYTNNIVINETYIDNVISISEQTDNNELFGIFYSNNFKNGMFDNETQWFATLFKGHFDKSEFEENTFEFKGKTNKNLLVQSVFNLFINSPKYLSELKIFSYSDGQGSFGSGQLKSLIYHAKTILMAKFLQKNMKNIPFEISGGIAIHINESRYNKSTNILNSIRKYIKNPHCDDIISYLEQGRYMNDFYIVNFHIFFHILDIYLDYIFNCDEAVDFLQFSFDSLSGGEENYLLMLALLELGIGSHSHIYSKYNPNIVLLLDEPEHTFHPEWQKNTMVYLLDFLSVFVEIKFHIILTSHSPFLLSDIPKQNIIFLKDGTVDKGINHEQTFGANIHTLLSDSFFMEDGLMGEFAKSKINEIIDFHEIVKKERHKNCLRQIYLNSKKTKFWQIQSIVGEAYLKQILENHLIEIEKILLGKDGAKESKKERLLAQLKELDND